MSNIKSKKDQLRTYLNKDFNSFRSNLLRYAQTFFSDHINDFSEASLGGLLLDMNAYVGDTMAYYLDHQFNELDINTAVEDVNIERLIRSAGVPITGAAPSTANVNFFIRVDSDPSNTDLPLHQFLPIIREGTVVQSSKGVRFTLTEDLDFSMTDDGGNYLFQKIIPSNAGSDPSSYILKMSGLCVSGQIATETRSFGNNFQPFQKIVLPHSNVSEVLSVKDTDGNTYYEVDSLVQNTVYRRVKNTQYDLNEVPDNLELLPAPYRFTRTVNGSTYKTTITFGSGRADTLDNDIIPDPSELSLPLYGKKTFSRFSIDPNNLLRTRTLGISPVNTTVSIRYRHGGGLSHNVGPGSISGVGTLLTTFKGGVPAGIVSKIRASVDVRNPLASAGGENAPSIRDLKQYVKSARNSQSRIVTREDLLAHVYMMPSRFGRVYRAGIRSNPNNPLSTQLFIVSRSASGLLSISPDALKQNLRLFLNESRLISDAIDILDSPVVNLGVKYSIVVDTTSNRSSAIQMVNSRIMAYFRNINFQIDQPVIVSEIQAIVLNAPGVISVPEFEIINRAGVISGMFYSTFYLDIDGATHRGIISPPAGGIFEMRYPTHDIIGTAE